MSLVVLFGGAVSSVYVHCGTLLNTPVFPYEYGVCG